MHNCCVDGASRIEKWNVNERSNARKSLFYEGDCDCRISSKYLGNTFRQNTQHTALTSPISVAIGNCIYNKSM